MLLINNLIGMAYLQNKDYDKSFKIFEKTVKET